MDPEVLQRIVDDPTRSAEDKRIAREALNEVAPLSPQAVSMLRALGKERIEDLADADIQKYIARNGNRYSDPVLAESVNWIAPDDTWLRLLGWGDERGWWNHVLDRAIVANRPNVQSHAQRKLQELEARP